MRDLGHNKPACFRKRRLFLLDQIECSIATKPSDTQKIAIFPLSIIESRDCTHRISDLDLASRLSFFLWSSIPDDELLGLAIRGELSKPEVLEQQVRRMLADSRS